MNVRLAGAKLHVALAGMLQESWIVPAYPFTGVTVNVALPLLPDFTVSEEG